MTRGPELREVPIERVLTNLQTRFERNTNDFEATYYLARVHSMAYATDFGQLYIRVSDGMPLLGRDYGDAPVYVDKRVTDNTRNAAFEHLTNAIALYERAIVLLKLSTNINLGSWPKGRIDSASASYKALRVLPVPIGLAWCLEQAGRTNDAISMYRKTLEAAWRIEVTGDFDFKQWVTTSWEDVKPRAYPPGTNGFSGGFGMGYSGEVIDSLLRLLERPKDKEEIGHLNFEKWLLARLAQERGISPILIPMETNAGFEELMDEHATVAFDLDGSGFKRKWAWITPKAGWLVFDAERTGCVDSALQMFGNVTFWIFWPNGYEALSALDDNGDGILSGDELRGLAVWNDRNGDGVSDPGEVIPVEELGIEAISCRSEKDGNGMEWNPTGVIMKGGEMRASYDWVVPGRDDEGGEELLKQLK